MLKIHAIRGMNDILPAQTPYWQFFEDKVRHVLSVYGYAEIRMPLVEQTNLFCRSIGEVTDIVEKEMYTFLDRNGESLSLRPEGTASCVRACEEHGLIYNQVQRLWYAGPMFRYEKPQKGRYRQFHQVGVETFGMPGPEIDAELLLLSARLWVELGIDHAVTLQINTLGSLHARNMYKEALVEYLQTHSDSLDEDSKRRLVSNPLRILDSKNSQVQHVLQDAPQMLEYLDEESKTHFEQLKAILSSANISFEVNPRLVRGLDYYGKTVFEWVTTKLGAQGTLCAGGRYDGLVEQLGGKSTPAIGFAMGVERIMLLLANEAVVPEYAQRQAEVYIVVQGVAAKAKALLIAEVLRNETNYRIMTDCSNAAIKNQLKKADRAGALVAILLGEDEIARDSITLKPLRGQAPQYDIVISELANGLQKLLGSV